MARSPTLGAVPLMPAVEEALVEALAGCRSRTTASGQGLAQESPPLPGQQDARRHRRWLKEPARAARIAELERER
jgi:hypothetical protein